jgi:hypothetical protein
MVMVPQDLVVLVYLRILIILLLIGDPGLVLKISKINVAMVMSVIILLGLVFLLDLMVMVFH